MDQLWPQVCMLPARKHILIGLIVLGGQFGDHLQLLHQFPWEFHLPLQAAYQRFLFNSLPEKGSGTYLFFFSFSLIASDDLNAPCRLMPGTACWLDIPEFGSDIRLLEMKLSFLHLLSIFFFLTSLLEYNSFTVVCSFLLYNKVNQLYMYIYPHIPSLSHLPPTLPIPPSPPPRPTAWSVHTWERAGLCAY